MALAFGLFGLHRGVNTEPETLVRRAELAEVAGFEALWVGDHVTLPYGEQALPGNPADQPRLKVVVALGASLADRGARTDEYLAAMRAIWDESAPSFAGQFVSFDEVMQRPLPVQRPNPPIVVGGSSPAAYRRAIVSGNGFYASRMNVERAAEVLGEIRKLSGRHERPAELGELEITLTPSEEIDLDTARRYADLGVHRLLLWPHDVGEAGTLERYIETVGSTLIGKV